jgi:cytochrome c oxidase subunit 2
MLAHVVVHPPGGYEAWLDEQAKAQENMPPVDLGKLLYERQGCSTCHTVDGTPKIGPTWKGVFGTEHALADGSKVVVDENYIKESIIDPNAKVVQGFVPSMPTYQGKLSPKQLDGIIAYIKSLK